jgi:hypothetical protein
VNSCFILHSRHLLKQAKRTKSLRIQPVSALTHKFGLEIDLTSPEARHPDHQNAFEAKILKEDGINHVEYSKEHPGIIAVEYDPSVTTPDAIYLKVNRLDGNIKRKVFL